MTGRTHRLGYRITASLLVAAFALGTSIHLGHHASPHPHRADSGCLACQVHQTGALESFGPDLPAVGSVRLPSQAEPALVFAAPQRRLPEPRGPPSA